MLMEPWAAAQAQLVSGGMGEAYGKFGGRGDAVGFGSAGHTPPF